MNPSTLISRRRTELMGLAAILIILHHCDIRLPFSAWNYAVNRNGSMGVDFFAFLSGFGCVFSLKKSSGPGRFFARRLEKLLPAYYVCLALMYAILGVPSFASLASSVIPLNAFTGEPGGSWYVSASLLYYLLIPGALALLDRAHKPWAMFVLLLLAAALIIPGATRSTDWTLAVMRLPALTCGIAAGALCFAEAGRRNWIAACAAAVLMYAAGLVLMRHPYALSRAPLDLISHKQALYLEKGLRAPLWLLLLAAALEGLERTPLRFLNVPLRHAGRRSLELYLGHELVEAFFVTCFGFSGWRRWAVMILLAWPAAMLLHYAGRWLLRLAKKLPLLK